MVLAATQNQIPDWHVVQARALAGVDDLTAALVDAWDAQQARVDVPSLAASIQAYGSDNIDWRVELGALHGAMVSVCGPIARDVALTLLPRYETPTEVFFNPYHDKSGRFASGPGGGGPGDMAHLEGRVLPAGYMYHGTPVRNLQSIRREGLKPGRTGLFLGRHDEPGWTTGQSAIVRVANSRVSVTRRGGGWVHQGTIRPEHLEYWAKDQTWRSLTELPEKFTEAYGDWIDLDLELRFLEAEKFLERYLPTLIVRITDETRRAIREAILFGFQNGKHPYEMAEEIAKMVGMTPGQVRAYRRFAANLMAGSLAPSRQAVALAEFRNRAIHLRARNIARTETLRAANAGQQELWRRADANGLLGPAKRIWIATPTSSRTCDACLDMNGETAPVDGVFIADGFGIDSPPLHPSCRCAMGLVFP